MNDREPARAASTSAWRIPDWYRRVGLASWFLIGISAAVALVAGLIAATSEITAPLVLGGFLAVVFLPIADWLAGRGLSRSLAALVVLVVSPCWPSASGGVSGPRWWIRPTRNLRASIRRS